MSANRPLAHKTMTEKPLLIPKEGGDETEFEVNSGFEHIRVVMNAAQALHRENPSIPCVTFLFNDISVSVNSDTNIAHLYREYSRAKKFLIAPQVGPNPAEELSEFDSALLASTP